ncbi:MAG: acyl-CoA synthetase [Azonexus sp.]|jgi:acyl-CoA synthetase (AMP-forming)/AMP-acid ligase II|nr:acyl-CoA synthetase [Azonexus sp.]
MKPDEFAAEKYAVIMGHSGDVLCYGEMAERSRRFARYLHNCGLRSGDVAALLFDNRAEFFEVLWGAHRLGLSYTLLNWHLSAQEVAYVLQDSGARALIVSDHLVSLGESVAGVIPDAGCCLLVGNSSPPPGFTAYQAAIAKIPDEPLPDELEGQPMLYSAGTTGRPKGIKQELDRLPFGTTSNTETWLRHCFAFDDTSVLLCPAPLYHAAPLAWAMTAQRIGATVVLMEQFDAIEVLRLVERYRITHAFMVPTHFVRLLKLAESDRHGYDLSSLKFVVHAGAPCPVDIKEQMLAWWGPILHEYYSCSEGIGLTMISPADWRDHRGSVGRAVGCEMRIMSEAGAELPIGEEGLVYFTGGVPFRYHNAPEQTAAAHDKNGWATVGDMGYLDADGFLYLTGRSSHMIISGGVNIYPEEIENILILHPAVADVAVIGIPHAEFGEEVKALVVPSDALSTTCATAHDLIGYCRSRLAHFKCPRSIEFVESLPRLPTGKLAKRLLKGRYGSPLAASPVFNSSPHQ